MIGIIGTEGSGVLRRLVEDPQALGSLATEALRILRELELAVDPPVLITAWGRLSPLFRPSS